MAPKIVIHAGLHKTGTTYIQDLLSANRQNLWSKGIHYPKYGNNNHTGFVALARGGSTVGNQKQKKWLDRQTKCGKIIILSSEEFCIDFRSPERTRKYRDLFKQFSTTIALYFRRPDHLLESAFSQVCKSHFCGTLKSYVFRHNFWEIMECPIREFGPENILPLSYKKTCWHRGDIGLNLIFRSTGCEVGGLSTPPKTNEGLPRRKTLFLSALNAPRELKLRVSDALSRMNTIADDGIKFLSSPSFRDGFYAGHRSSARRALEPFGIQDIDDFLGYDGQDDHSKWRPPAPITDQEFTATLRRLDELGIDLREFGGSVDRSVFDQSY